ncbi:MAG: ABC transporter ATP-binding protein [Planctomycetes bacterium]|nr:ABC transporter ATP-binding protein [Planctomycetota bacterium]
MSDDAPPLLEVRDLVVRFDVVTPGGPWGRRRTLTAVDGVHVSVRRGETLGLVGESGCGKSTTGRAVLQLEKPSAGEVIFDGRPIHEWWVQRWGGWRWDHRLRDLRRRMQMIFQDPSASLDPRMTVEAILAEPLRNFALASGSERRGRVQRLLEIVGLDPRFIRRYPHQFSGGQRQRIGIARALALEPDLIVADEPTSGLDVSIQAQIVNLLGRLQQELGLTMMFIAHDLATVRHVSDRIAVMHLGRIVELAAADRIVTAPLHPYTQALVAAVPVPDPIRERARPRLVLAGEPPSPLDPPAGCPFHTRCPVREERCRRESPPLRTVAAGHEVACHLVD